MIKMCLVGNKYNKKVQTFFLGDSILQLRSFYFLLGFNFSQKQPPEVFYKKSRS